jgi:hypothetical protein
MTAPPMGAVELLGTHDGYPDAESSSTASSSLWNPLAEVAGGGNSTNGLTTALPRCARQNWRQLPILLERTSR